MADIKQMHVRLYQKTEKKYGGENEAIVMCQLFSNQTFLFFFHLEL